MNHAQAGKSKIGHGASRRADVERVAAVDEDDARAILFREGKHERPF
jgi:hypothetical protein